MIGFTTRAEERKLKNRSSTKVFLGPCDQSTVNAIPSSSWKLTLLLLPYHPRFPFPSFVRPTLAVRLMERIATNDGKVKAVSDCKWTEGKSHRWRRFVQFEGMTIAQVRAERKDVPLEKDRFNHLFDYSWLFRDEYRYFVPISVEIIWKWFNGMFEVKVGCSWWKKGIVEVEGELSKIQPVAKRCVGGNWRNREGNEIWNSVTLLLPRVVWNWIFQVFARIWCLFRVS